jgi:signal peptidase II
MAGINPPAVPAAAGRPPSPAAFWIAVGAVLLLDQASKWLVSHFLALYQSIPLLGNVLSLTYVRNPGAAFSFLAQPFAAPWRLYLLAGIAVITFAVLVYLVHRDRRLAPALFVPMGMVGGGALGNLVDRVTAGRVVDFIDFSYRSFHFPVFNIADSSVCIAVGWILLHSFLHPDAEGK